MASKYIDQNDMVEGQKCHIVARKVEFKNCGLRKDPIANDFVVVYSLDRNCSVEVKESLVMTDEEKQHRDNLNVHYNVGDKLEADAIRLYVASKKNCLKLGVTMISGRHNAQVADTKVRTIGIIQTPLNIYAKLLGFSPNTDVKQIENK